MDQELPGGAVATRTVAILCAATQTHYRAIDGLEIYDAKRDARTFRGGMPVVAHPPCRAWSTFVSHQAKPQSGERDLGPMCVDWVMQCGGVLEHPAHSRLWDYCDLPAPGEYRSDHLFALEVWQAWWGYSMRKATWLLFCGVDFRELHIPHRPHLSGEDRRRQQLMSKRERAETVPAFAEWLVDAARKSRHGATNRTPPESQKIDGKESAL